MADVKYNVFKLNISEGLNDNELSLGDGDYVILQYAPPNVEVGVRINNNFNAEIKLKQNSGFEAKGVQKLYITCPATPNGTITFLQGKTSEDFRYIPPTYGKIDVGTVDEIKKMPDITVDKINNFGDDIYSALCHIINGKWRLSGITQAAIHDEIYNLQEVLSKELQCDKIKINLLLKPKVTYGEYIYIQPLENTLVFIYLDDVLVDTIYQSYYSVMKAENKSYEGVRGKTLRIVACLGYKYVDDNNKDENGNPTIEKYFTALHYRIEEYTMSNCDGGIGMQDVIITDNSVGTNDDIIGDDSDKGGSTDEDETADEAPKHPVDTYPVEDYPAEDSVFLYAIKVLYPTAYTISGSNRLLLNYLIVNLKTNSYKVLYEQDLGSFADLGVVAPGHISNSPQPYSFYMQRYGISDNLGNMWDENLEFYDHRVDFLGEPANLFVNRTHQVYIWGGKSISKMINSLKNYGTYGQEAMYIVTQDGYFPPTTLYPTFYPITDRLIEALSGVGND
ncbi:MAG: hypothetical protein LBQ18_05970 [Campylobacteraceae bacterium]|jgi:hypothetical protein|nr:hypothetical protein [Campylobacteraceae bacterium]